MSLRSAFRGPEASIDDQIESYAIDRVPDNKRWPIPAISLVLLGNATAMFFFSFGAQQTLPGRMADDVASDRLLLLRSDPHRCADHAHGEPRRTVAEPDFPWTRIRQPRCGGDHLVHLCDQLRVLLPVRGHPSCPTRLAFYFDIPIGSLAGVAIFALIGLVTIGFVWRGMYAMSALQTWGFPIFVGLLVWALISLGSKHDCGGPQWLGGHRNVRWRGLVDRDEFCQRADDLPGLDGTDYGRFAKRTIRYRGTASIMLLELVPMFAVIFLGAMLGASLVGEFGTEKGTGSRLRVRAPHRSGGCCLRAGHPDPDQRDEPVRRVRSRCRAVSMSSRTSGPGARGGCSRCGCSAWCSMPPM